jgi:hypothetical protein
MALGKRGDCGTASILLRYVSFLLTNWKAKDTAAIDTCFSHQKKE